MNKLRKLIGEGGAMFASVLCLLTFAFLAPSAWAAEKCTSCITFSADAAFGIKLVKGTEKTVPTVNLEYSTDQETWLSASAETGYDAKSDGGVYKIHFRGSNNSQFSSNIFRRYANSFTNTVGSKATAIACSGNVMTLLDWETVSKGQTVTMSAPFTFLALFCGFTSLTAAPELPADTMIKNCYRYMFQDCTSLAEAPRLPAKTLALGCYQGMFQRCTSLKTPPELPATNLAANCYEYMFMDCPSLTTVPELPGSKLETLCYECMFSGCKSLTTIPELNISLVTNLCCFSMFSNCLGIAVNMTGPGREWKIPDGAVIGGTKAQYLPIAQWDETHGRNYWASNMFSNTSGELNTAAEVKIGQTYYIASAPTDPIPYDVTAPAHTTIKVYSNDVASAAFESTDGTVASNWVAVVVYTADEGWFFADGATAVTNKLDTTVNPAVDKSGKTPTAANWERKEVDAKNSPYLLEEGYTYTAAPTTEHGGAFYVNKGATLTGTNVTFSGNEVAQGKVGGAICNDGGTLSLYGGRFTGNKATKGAAISSSGTAALKGVTFADNEAEQLGAINNTATGMLSLDDVTFEGNKAMNNNGAINNNKGKVHFDGTVTLRTATDKIYNSGMLNWNLADGKAGRLNGYDKLTNGGNGTLQLTVDAATEYPAVIATGDFSSIKNKDTFVITNATTGATATIKIGGDVAKVGGDWYTLSVAGGRLTLALLPTATLSNVPILGKGGVTNATASVWDNGEEVKANADGTYTVHQGLPIKLFYSLTPDAQEDYLFGSCLTQKSVYLDPLSGNYALTAADKPAVEPRWVDVREIAIDTRERIVVGHPEDVLPIAYSTNFWGEAEGAQKAVVRIQESDERNYQVLVNTDVNGYVEWMPAVGAFGQYDFVHICEPALNPDRKYATIYYSQPYALTWSSAGGTLAVTNAGAAIASGDEVPGYDIVTFTAKPAEGYVLKGDFKVLTNGVEVAGAVTGDEKSGYRFDMPYADAVIQAPFVKKTGLTVNGEDIAYGSGKGWEYDESNRMLTLNASLGGGTNKVTLAGGAVGAGVKLIVKKTTFDEIVFNNFTNDCSGTESNAMVVQNETIVTLVGTNYLAGGVSAAVVNINGGYALTLRGEGTLVAVPGAKQTIPAGIGVGTSASAKILGGTYTSTVDPDLATDTTNKRMAFSNGDGTWTVKDYAVVTFTGVGDVKCAKGESIPSAIWPENPTKEGMAFNCWTNATGDACYPDEAKFTDKTNLYAWWDNNPKATYVDEKGEEQLAKNVNLALGYAPEGGKIVATNEVIDGTVVTKPVVLVGSENKGVAVEPVSGLAVAYSTNAVDGTVVAAVGTNVADVVVVEKPLTQPEVPVVEKPTEADPASWKKVTEAVATTRTPDVMEIVGAKALEDAAAVAKTAEADAIVTEVKLLVEPTGVMTNKKVQVIDFTVDVKPVLTVYGIKDGAMTNVLAATTNNFALSGKPVTVTLDVSGFGRTPMLITHTHGAKTEYIFHPGIALEGEKTFVYDAVAKTLSFEMSEFSPVTVSFEEPQTVSVTLDANGGYFGLESVSTKTVAELIDVNGGTYRHLTADDVPSHKDVTQTFMGWYYDLGGKDEKLVQKGDALASTAPHTLKAKWTVKAHSLYTTVTPVECGNASTKTNGVWSGWALPNTVVTAVATPASNCVLGAWSGKDGTGKAIAFADAHDLVTTFTMPMADVYLMATFKVDPKYQAKLTKEIDDAAVAAKAEIDALNLSPEAKKAFSDEVASNRTVQVAAVLAAQTPDAAHAAKAAADEAFAKTLEKAQRLAAVPYAVACRVAPTNEAGTVAVTNMAKAYTLVDVEAKPEANWTFVSWAAYTNGVALADAFTNKTTAVSAFAMPETNVTVEATYAVDPAYRAETAQAVSNVAAAAVGAITNMNLSAESKDDFGRPVADALTNAVAAIGAAQTPAEIAAAATKADEVIAAVTKAAQAWADREWTVVATVDPDDAGTVNVSTNRSQARQTITVTAVPAANWTFLCWKELDPTNGIVTLKTMGDPTLVFAMPETNVNLLATFMLDEGFRAEGVAAITNAAVAAKAEIDGLDLSDEDKKAFELKLRADAEKALEAVGEAKTPGEVEAAVADALKAFAETVAEAQALAGSVWPIESIAEPADGGTVSVTNCSKALQAVTVTATVNANWAFKGWSGQDDAGKAIAFADATNLVTTFVMPATNVAVVATFAVDETYRAETHDAVNAAMTNSLATVDGLALTDEEKAGFAGGILDAGTNALAKIDAATTPAEIAAASLVTQSFVAQVQAAIEVANRMQPIGYGCNAGDAGTVTVPDAAKRWTTVTVEAALTNDLYAFVGWYGEAGEDPVAFADATNLVTTFEMPDRSVEILAVFKVREAYKAAGGEKIEAAAEQTIVEIDTLRLTAAQKAYYAAMAYDAATNGLAVVDQAYTTKAVDTAVAETGSALAAVLAAAKAAQEPEGGFVAFATNRVEGIEGKEIAVVVRGGSLKGPTQVTLSLQKNTLTSFAATYGTDAKGKAKAAKFPLVLNWDAGDLEPKTVVFTAKAGSKVDVDKFLTLQLGGEAALKAVEPSVCTLVVRDAAKPAADETPYVRALAWPANGGKVSGFGALKLKGGEYASARTLTAKANRWATFAGWYAAKADDPNAIDLSKKLTAERKLKVGKGTDCGAGTYFAYFTDVTPVASVSQPDIASAKGLACDEGVYVGTVGVKVSLPVSFEDATGDGSMTVSGLPSGLKYDKKAGLITGVPTKEMQKTATFVAKNSAGKHTATFVFAIDDLDARAIGTFDGVLRDDVDGDAGRAGMGSVTFTAGKAGALSAKVTTREAGTEKFSAKGYDRIDAETLGITVTNRSGAVFAATLKLGKASKAWAGTTVAITGTVAGGDFTAAGETGAFELVRNDFAKSEKNEAALAALAACKGTYETALYASKDATLQVGTASFKVGDNGTVTVKTRLFETLDGIRATQVNGKAGAFRYDAATGAAGIEIALVSGDVLWSADVVLDADKLTAKGVSRCIAPHEDKSVKTPVDVDLVVGETAK